MARRIDIQKTELEYYYNTLGYTMKQIAERYDCAPNTVRLLMIKYKVKRRSKWKITDEKLYHLYYEENRSIGDIALTVGMTEGHIKERLKKLKA